jgi:hypothetical protein
VEEVGDPGEGAEGGSAAPLATQLLRGRRPGVEITLGPTFIYEYARDLVDSCGAGPDAVRVLGGLDCAGGWTWGCTYASSLYQFLKVPLGGPIEEVLRRVFEADLLGRPFIAGGIEKIGWGKVEDLPAARDIQLAASGRFILEALERPVLSDLAPDLERFINQGDQARIEEYADLCRRVEGMGIDGRAKRDVTLAYLSLPAPGGLPGDLGSSLERIQLERLAWAAGDEGKGWYERASKDLFALVNRIAWIGLDEAEGGGVALWVRTVVDRYALEVLSGCPGIPPLHGPG